MTEKERAKAKRSPSSTMALTRSHVKMQSDMIAAASGSNNKKPSRILFGGARPPSDDEQADDDDSADALTDLTALDESKSLVAALQRETSSNDSDRKMVKDTAWTNTPTTLKGGCSLRRRESERIRAAAAVAAVNKEETMNETGSNEERSEMSPPATTHTNHHHLLAGKIISDHPRPNDVSQQHIRQKKLPYASPTSIAHGRVEPQHLNMSSTSMVISSTSKSGASTSSSTSTSFKQLDQKKESSSKNKQTTISSEMASERRRGKELLSKFDQAKEKKKKKSEPISKPKKDASITPETDNTSNRVSDESRKFVRQAWTDTEDCQLRHLVNGFTRANQRIRWVEISGEISGRSGKQCRERWMYHLQPGLNKCEYTPEEDALIERLVEKMGSKWCNISQLIPGRNDMDVKNRWHYLDRAKRRRVAHRRINDAAHRGQKESPAVKDALVNLCDVALEPIIHFPSSCNNLGTEGGGDTSTEGTVSSGGEKTPEVGTRVRVRFESDDGNDYTFYGGTITKVFLNDYNSITSRLQDMAADLDIDALAIAVASAAPKGEHRKAAYQPSDRVNVCSSRNVNSSASQSRIEIRYDDGTIEKDCIFPDPDIEIVACCNLSEEEMSLSIELLNLNDSLNGLRGVHAKKRKHSDVQCIFPEKSDVKSWSFHSNNCVPLETVRELLLGRCDPIELATRLLPSDDVALVREKWKKSD